MTKKTKANPEDYIGIKVDSYTIKEYINKGAISFVFKAEDDNGNIVACKVIPQENRTP